MRLAAMILLTACAEPVVEMKFQVNTDTNDTSCVTAVEVRAIGADFLTDAKDFKRSCITVTNKSNLAAIRDDIRGKFTLDMPDSGLAGISLFGWSGPNACEQTDTDPYYTPDLAFFGRADYIGQEVLDVSATPNLNCARKQVKARIVDLFQLVSGATPSSSTNCTTAMAFPDMEGGLGVGTLMPKLFGKGAVYYGGLAGAAGLANLATIDAAMVEVGTKSCLALDGGNDRGGSTSCAVAGPVCGDATVGEVELIIVAGPIIQATPALDLGLIGKFPGVIYGSVWSGGATKTPIAGATIAVDSTHGKVVYIDPPDAGTGTVKKRGDQSTGPTGLFMIYADTLVSAKVTANGKTRTVTLGATNDSVAGVVVVMD